MKNGLVFTLLFVLINFFPPLPNQTVNGHNRAASHAMESAFIVKFSPNPFIKNFAVESTKTDLNLEVFTPDGLKIPTTIYKYHSNGVVKYETGAELNEGIYLVRLSTEFDSVFYKMIKMN